MYTDEIQFLPNRKDLTALFLPEEAQLPPGDLAMMVFVFDGLTARQTAEEARPIEKRSVLWGITGNDSDAAGFRVQITQEHQGRLIPLLQKPVEHRNVIGTAQAPTILKETRLLEPGDSITVEAKSLSANGGVRIEVVLWLAVLHDDPAPGGAPQ
ncbi:MAG TPA: hypothetical protein VH024_00295 [Candidatus Angelobacter sp.]|jgi:hypothetical protein|nr:hypothetical protein [Candidatus Angelobacter sp.]